MGGQAGDSRLDYEDMGRIWVEMYFFPGVGCCDLCRSMRGRLLLELRCREHCYDGIELVASEERLSLLECYEYVAPWLLWYQRLQLRLPLQRRQLWLGCDGGARQHTPWNLMRPKCLNLFWMYRNHVSWCREVERIVFFWSSLSYLCCENGSGDERELHQLRHRHRELLLWTLRDGRGDHHHASGWRRELELLLDLEKVQMRLRELALGVELDLRQERIRYRMRHWLEQHLAHYEIETTRCFVCRWLFQVQLHHRQDW